VQKSQTKEQQVIQNRFQSDDSVVKEQGKAIYSNRQTLNIRVISFINHSHHVCVMMAAGHY
jgi:hypothetical protein